MALNEDQRRTLERLLLKDRDRALRHLRQFDASLAEQASNQFSTHMAEQGTDMMEREKAFLLAGEEGQRLLRIDAALTRLYDDPETFGVCRVCGQEISFERLEAVPQTELCVADKKAEEEQGG